LREYQAAVNELNAARLHAIWPAADVAELGNAFEQIYQQRLDLENCKIAAAGSTAVATCTGTLRYVEKGSKKSEQVERALWEFSLREQDAKWQIDSVTRVVTR
jgi:hypothetical protein